jgi:sugar lactone lactonase YvrE
MTGSKRVRTAIVLVIVGLFNDALAAAGADNAIRIELSNDRAFPESLTASSDGALYVSSPATGGITRIPHGATRDEPWIKPGAFDTRSTFGVLVDNASHILWVCSNDVSAFGVPGPSSVSGSYLKGFDLRTGEGKVSAALPGARPFCNDIAIGPDGSLFVTNSLALQLLRLRPGSNQLEVWLEDQQFAAPSQGAGLDGIAFGSDGHLYVNTFTKGELFRIEVHDGAPGKVTKLQTSRPLMSPDGLRVVSELTFVMVEGNGTLDRVIVAQDQASIETLAAGFSGPTAVAVVGTTAWVAEGQLSHLFDPAKNGSPRLPFHIKAVPLGK